MCQSQVHLTIDQRGSADVRAAANDNEDGDTTFY